MKYGIKVNWGDDVETWLTSMSEYVTAGNIKPALYNTREEAEEAIKVMQLKNSRVEQYE